MRAPLPGHPQNPTLAQLMLISHFKVICSKPSQPGSCLNLRSHKNSTEPHSWTSPLQIPSRGPGAWGVSMAIREKLLPLVLGGLCGLGSHFPRSSDPLRLFPPSFLSLLWQRAAG